MQRLERFRTGFAPFLLALFGSVHALAQTPPSKPSAAPAPISFSKGALAKLKSTDASEIEAGLDEARLAARAALPAVPLIVSLLEKGLPFPLTQRAIDTLGDIESEQASFTLSFYARHRSVAIRRSAVKALIHTKGAPAVKALRVAL